MKDLLADYEKAKKELYDRVHEIASIYDLVVYEVDYYGPRWDSYVWENGTLEVDSFGTVIRATYTYAPPYEDWDCEDEASVTFPSSLLTASDEEIKNHFEASVREAVVGYFKGEAEKALAALRSLEDLGVPTLPMAEDVILNGRSWHEAADEYVGENYIEF